jgi:N-acetylmuramoyl-L-alanine amidase
MNCHLSVARAALPPTFSRGACFGALLAAHLFAPTAWAQGARAQDAPPVIAKVQAGRADVPRVELAARLKAAGLTASLDYAMMRDNAARELAGRPDGAGGVSAAEVKAADAAIAAEVARLAGPPAPPQSLAELARLPGRPQIPGLRLIYINPLGDPADANPWHNILAHQTEGPPGSARASALAQAANPTKRGVALWVETDGTVYWATSERVITTHGDGANRNDNKYIDNSTTFHSVIKTNTIGVEFIGNYPDVAKPVTPAQMQAWLILVRFLQERYGIPAENIYAHNWIDYKDTRYCEGCALAEAARAQAYQPTSRAR